MWAPSKLGLELPRLKETHSGRRCRHMWANNLKRCACSGSFAKNLAGELPFLASSFGRWWGTDPRDKAETDIDLIAADRQSKSILLGECKWCNLFDESKAIEMLERRAPLVKGFSRRLYCLFTKNVPSEATRKKASARDDLTLVSANEMFEA
mgnify:CR=1 FL=1